jgi:hypothetical protein
MLGRQIQLAHQQAPHGAVTSGEIVLCGRLRYMLVIESSGRPRLWSRDNPPVKQEFVTVWSDTHYADRSPKTLLAVCLQVCKYDAQSGEGPCGLILTSQDDIKFERVGVFSYEKWTLEDPQGFYVADRSEYNRIVEEQRTFFEGCDLRTITIV